MAFGRFAFKTVTVAALASVGFIVPVHSQQSTNTSLTTAMPVEQQNVIVQKYCAVCHDDAHRNGGLSLQRFDAAQVEPSLAAMMVSKLKTGALGAAGLPLPDKQTEQAFFNALDTKSAGSKEWIVTRTLTPMTNIPMVTASIVREIPVTEELYRLKLSCIPSTREGEMQLTWAPMSAQGSRVLSVSVDGHAPVTFDIYGRETMGNGAKAQDGNDVVSGSAAAVLYTNTQPGERQLALPSDSVNVTGLFSNETVRFPFDLLTASMRQQLSACFAEAGEEMRVRPLTSPLRRR